MDQGSEQDGLLPWDLFRLSLDRRPVVGKRRSVPVGLFLPPTLVASIYVMNFEFIPELKWPFGYPFAIGLMILSALLPYWFCPAVTVTSL